MVRWIKTRQPTRDIGKRGTLAKLGSSPFTGESSAKGSLVAQHGSDIFVSGQEPEPLGAFMDRIFLPQPMENREGIGNEVWGKGIEYERGTGRWNLAVFVIHNRFFHPQSD